MKALLLGAGGMLGHDLAATVPPDVELVQVGRDQVDITDALATAATFDSTRPDVVLNAAGFTAVDRAESESAAAFAVNGDSVGRLGAQCAARGIRVVHFSTDYVFAGTSTRPYRETDEPAPINVYGASKLAGEVALLTSGADALIVRTQWLFGSHGTSFPRTMWDRANRHLPTSVVADQRGRPTRTIDLARATWQLVHREAAGVIHIANAGSASWYEVAEHIFSIAGASELLSKCESREYSRPAARPLFSVLDTTRAEELLGALPHWTVAVSEFLRTLAASDRRSTQAAR
jgi:dTDP-4-dehydrorhamnose reductase